MIVLLDDLKDSGLPLGPKETFDNRPYSGSEEALNVGLKNPENPYNSKFYGGRAACLKIRFPHGIVGSIPTEGTIAEMHAGQRYMVISKFLQERIERARR